MFKVVLITGFLSITSVSFAHGALPTADPVDVATVTDPAKEIICLEAFVGSDFKQAYKICLPLARDGLKDAQLVTGLMYALGEGVEKDMGRARVWLEEAKRNGSRDAQEALNEFKLD